MFGADDLITEDGVRVGDFVGDFALTGTAVRAVDGFDVVGLVDISGDDFRVEGEILVGALVTLTVGDFTVTAVGGFVVVGLGNTSGDGFRVLFEGEILVGALVTLTVGDFALTGTAVRAVDGFDVDDFEGIRGDCDLLGFAVFALGLALGLLDEGARVGTLVGFEGDVVVGGTDLV